MINEKPSPSCDLFCIEVLKHKETTEDDGAYILVTWVNVLKEGPIEKRFGSPYTIQVSREVLYEDLQKLLMKEMASILHDDILIANQKVCKIRFLSGFCTIEKSLLSNFLRSITPLFEHILLHMHYKMCSKSGVMDH